MPVIQRANEVYYMIYVIIGLYLLKFNKNKVYKKMKDEHKYDDDDIIMKTKKKTEEKQKKKEGKDKEGGKRGDNQTDNN